MGVKNRGILLKMISLRVNFADYTTWHLNDENVRTLGGQCNLLLNSEESCSFLSNISSLQLICLSLAVMFFQFYSTKPHNQYLSQITSSLTDATQLRLDVPTTSSLAPVVSEDDITFKSHLCFGFSCQSLVFRNNTLPWLLQFFTERSAPLNY